MVADNGHNHSVKWFAPVPAFLLLGCAQPAPPTESLMEQIEASVRLPDGAYPMNAYGRYYAYSDPKRVEAFYLLPYEAPDADEECSIIDPDTDLLAPCSDEVMRQLRETDAMIEAQLLTAGERRWFADAAQIPIINDGGCIQVHILYDIPTRRFLRVECNGNA